jgi:hypothetical protein
MDQRSLSCRCKALAQSHYRRKDYWGLAYEFRISVCKLHMNLSRVDLKHGALTCHGRSARMLSVATTGQNVRSYGMLPHECRCLPRHDMTELSGLIEFLSCLGWKCGCATIEMLHTLLRLCYMRESPSEARMRISTESWPGRITSTYTSRGTRVNLRVY